MFGEMYDEMLERIDKQVERTKELRATFIETIKKYKALGREREKK